MLLSFTGTRSVIERSHHRAVYQALYHHSLSTSPTSFPLEFFVRDVGCDPRVCAAHVIQLAQRGIKIFIGFLTPPCLQVILPILESYDCLLFCLTPYKKGELQAPLMHSFEHTAGNILPLESSSTMSHSFYNDIWLLLDALTQIRSLFPFTWLGYMRGKAFACPFRNTLSESIHLQIHRHIHIGNVDPESHFEISWETNPLPAPPPLHEPSPSVQSSPNWKALLCAWGEKSQECIVALSSKRIVLFANRLAADRFSLQRGTLLDENWEQSLKKKWTIEEHAVGEETLQRLLIIRPRTTFRTRPTDSASFPAIQTNSPLYQTQLHSARIAAHSVTNTLLLGETGSGKEVLARAIHSCSTRKNGPFIPVNIAAFPRDLIASELFGYVDGAFTGAKKGGQIGKFEAANGGTLFLDEIGDMTLDLQVFLLRVLEERKVTRLGDHREKPLDVRIIAATNRMLEADVKSGRFRADLYYRLNILQIRIPPLRDRKEDIAPLADVFLKQLRAQYGIGPTGVCDEAIQALLAHDWAGNVRELRNVMERAFLLALHESVIGLSHLPVEWKVAMTGKKEDGEVPLLRDMERQVIQQAIAEARSISAAAKKLGIARSTLYRKMGELGIG